MSFSASPPVLAEALRVEQRLCKLIREELDDRHSAAVVIEGSPDPFQNGKFGDCLIKPSQHEMHIIGIEIKSSSYPLSFSLSEFEKDNSVARWVLVEGTHGVWAVRMDVARKHLSEMKGPGKTYYVCQPPFESHVPLKSVLDDIQLTIGESVV